MVTEKIQMSVEELMRALHADPKEGLSSPEVKKRIKQYGYNEISVQKRHPLKKFLNKFWGITPWALECIILLSIYLRRWLDVYVVTALLIINALLSFMEEYLASREIESLRKKLAITVPVLRDGSWVQLKARELVPGDIISSKSGDLVVADVKLLSGSLSVDESALTGESLPKEKKYDDLVRSGSKVARGEATGLVIATGARTSFGKTVELVQSATPAEHIEKIVSVITKSLAVIVGILLAVFFIFSVKQGLPLTDMLSLMLVLFIGAIPVALPAMFTISMALAALQLSKKSVLVSRLNAVEDAAAVTVICVDKTGTLTQNKIAIAHVIPLGSTPENDIIAYGALASQRETFDPIDLAFITAAHEKKLSLQSYTLKKFVPFESTNKRTEAVIEKDGQELHIYKGAVTALQALAKPSREESELINRTIADFAQKGYRTIAVAKNSNDTVHIIGLIALADPARPESKKMLEELRLLGLSVKMLTGDALPIARVIANEVGLEGNAIAFEEYEKKKESDVSDADEIILKNSIFAEIFPADKYTIVTVLQKHGNVVAMTGDGLNDAPALKQAEVGIAVSNATEISKKAASIVLVQPGLLPIADLIKMGRLTFQRVNTWVINKISRTILKTGFIVIAFFITGRYIITSTHMLLLIFMTDFMKLSLATDNETIATRPCFWNIPELSLLAFLLGIAMMLEALILLYIGLYYLYIPYELMSTFCFQILFYFALFSLFVVREKNHFWHTMPSFTLLGVMLFDFIMAFVLTSYEIIGFRSMPIQITGFVICYAFFFSLVINDWIKYIFWKIRNNNFI